MPPHSWVIGERRMAEAAWGHHKIRGLESTGTLQGSFTVSTLDLNVNIDLFRLASSARVGYPYFGW